MSQNVLTPKRRKRLYFAHPATLYQTLLGHVIPHVLENEGYEVVNPHSVEYHRQYAAQMCASPAGNPMKYWMQLARTCDCCVFTGFPSQIKGEQKPAAKPRIATDIVRLVDDFHYRKTEIWWILPDVIHDEEDVVLVPFKSWRGFHRLNVMETEDLLRLQGVFC